MSVRDTLDCVAEANISSVMVTRDASSVADLMSTLQNASRLLNTNPLVQLLASGNQNTVGQTLTTICQELSKINQQSLRVALSSTGRFLFSCFPHEFDVGGLAAASVSVSSLASHVISTVCLVLLHRYFMSRSITQGAVVFNESILADYHRQLNLYANLRDFLMSFAIDLVVMNANSIKLQASTLSQLTEATNQLTRTAAVG